MEIYKVEFQIDLIPIPMKEVDVKIGGVGIKRWWVVQARWFVSKAQVGGVDRVWGEGANQNDVVSSLTFVRVKKEDIHKTAFRTRHGHYEFLVTSSRPRYCSAAFVDLMDRVYRPMLDRSVIVFSGECCCESEIGEGVMVVRCIKVHEEVELVVQTNLYLILVFPKLVVNSDNVMVKMSVGVRVEDAGMSTLSPELWDAIVRDALRESYANRRRSDLEFQSSTLEGGDPFQKGLSELGSRKLRCGRSTRNFSLGNYFGPRFIGLFKVIARLGNVAYRLELPEEL
ncbi:hypothetical protein OSB04_003392 [Centaurea solstitialis]|uniref:Tf2-1-like SH3-like domain-containing protein n=1 Tax=Centaurea solstitialis TaxID=347529 RepID=A0AA38WVP3_9ASTR|nr:hypothetical protein OSB04_003392 [Centaurea solstitialis]